MTTSSPTALAIAGVLLLGSCQSAYYATMEKFGVHKRDILVDRVEDARQEQTEAKEQFLTTFERFKQLSDFDGGELEKVYTGLNKELNRCESEAADVRDKIKSIETVSEDLFDEWESELAQIQNPDLRGKSSKSLNETRERCANLVKAMQRAEERMGPVLTAFRDQVLYLKHNLNAQAIASLQDTVLSIETDVSRLIEEMQVSIDEADKFIGSMSS